MKYSDVVVVVSPPRCASTALARVLWQVPSTRFYCHEPFDQTYHRGADVSAALAMLERPLDLKGLAPCEPNADALIVKEMSFQVGESLPLLAALTSRPIVFAIRDPRLAIASRMRRRAAGNQEPVFPLVESGWRWLDDHVRWARERGVPYVIVDTADLRSSPESTVRQLCDAIGLAYSHDLLSWAPAPTVELGGLDAEQRHWYERVLSSSGIEPDDELPPALETFPESGGLRDHVRKCIEIYAGLSDDECSFRSRLPTRLEPELTQ